MIKIKTRSIELEVVVFALEVMAQTPLHKDYHWDGPSHRYLCIELARLLIPKLEVKVAQIKRKEKDSLVSFSIPEAQVILLAMYGTVFGEGVPPIRSVVEQLERQSIHVPGGRGAGWLLK